MSDHYLSNRRHFTLPAGLARLIGKPMLFSLTNGWAKIYQVDSHRKTAEIQGNSDPVRMLSKLLIAWALTALCVIVHAMGMTVLLRWLRHSTTRVAARFWFSTWLLVRVAGWIILLHLVEIAMWAFFYTWKHGMPDLQSALYFSAVTYTTTGYGDLLLPNEWRLIGGIEALTGILMCGWSAAFFFAVVSRMNQTRSKPEQT